MTTMFHIPTGSYGVGVTDIHLIDDTRVEANASTPTPRELMLHIWYPGKRRTMQAGNPL